MPKRVDHRARRALIADALIRVAAERGLEAVSLRHVAAEAGVSAGMVQHYFRTKDEMMAFAVGAVAENVEARLAEAGGPAPDAPPRRPSAPCSASSSRWTERAGPRGGSHSPSTPTPRSARPPPG
ncbi:TetR/AcrR family transcriptional regulator [Nocardiopsis composta]